MLLNFIGGQSDILLKDIPGLLGKAIDGLIEPW
jgi:hypothetical protein